MSPSVYRRSLVTLLIVVPVVALGSAASAYWGGFGTGGGHGATGSTAPVTLSAGVPAAVLYPGGTADVVLTVSNPNRSIVHIGRLVLDSSQGVGGYAVDPGHTGCAASMFSYTAQSQGGLGWNIPAKVGTVDGSLAVTLPNALTLSLDAANACQGASATVFLAAAP